MSSKNDIAKHSNNGSRAISIDGTYELCKNDLVLVNNTSSLSYMP